MGEAKATDSLSMGPNRGTGTLFSSILMFSGPVFGRYIRPGRLWEPGSRPGSLKSAPEASQAALGPLKRPWGLSGGLRGLSAGLRGLSAGLRGLSGGVRASAGRRAASGRRAPGAGRFAKSLKPLPPHPDTHTHMGPLGPPPGPNLGLLSRAAGGLTT